MIFIISHHPKHRDTLSQFFEQRGYEICLAPHRENVYESVKQVKPHVVVLDVYLTEPNPADVLRQIRSEGFKGKVIILAGPSSSPLLSEIFRLGADQIIGGPQFSEESINLEHLESTIRSVVRPFITSRAYELFVARGGKEGNRHDEDWLQAEHEILFKKKNGS